MIRLFAFAPTPSAARPARATRPSSGRLRREGVYETLLPFLAECIPEASHSEALCVDGDRHLDEVVTAGVAVKGCERGGIS